MSALLPNPAGVSATAGSRWWRRMPLRKRENSMSKLTDTQLVVLSKAVLRDDDAAIVPDRINQSAAAKIATSLIARKLMREMRAKPGMPVWRKGGDGRALSLVITSAGKQAIGSVGSVPSEHLPISEKAAGVAIVGRALHASVKSPSSRSPTEKPGLVTTGAIVAPVATSTNAKEAVGGLALPPPDQPRAASKQALLIGMLQSAEGATIDAMMTATGWLPHTTRAALTGLRKRGFVVTRMSRESEASVYAIPVATPTIAVPPKSAARGKRA